MAAAFVIKSLPQKSERGRVFLKKSLDHKIDLTKLQLFVIKKLSYQFLVSEAINKLQLNLPLIVQLQGKVYFISFNQIPDPKWYNRCLL